jgi:hypothetical protein
MKIKILGEIEPKNSKSIQLQELNKRKIKGNFPWSATET